MKVFTYKNYIKCIHTLRLNAIFQLAEENANYNINRNKINNRHDKLIKNILKDEKEMRKFINDFLEPNEKIQSQDLIKYTNSYITKNGLAPVYLPRHKRSFSMSLLSVP